MAVAVSMEENGGMPPLDDVYLWGESSANKCLGYQDCCLSPSSNACEISTQNSQNFLIPPYHQPLTPVGDPYPYSQPQNYTPSHDIVARSLLEADVNSDSQNSVTGLSQPFQGLDLTTADNNGHSHHHTPLPHMTELTNYDMTWSATTRPLPTNAAPDVPNYGMWPSPSNHEETYYQPQLIEESNSTELSDIPMVVFNHGHGEDYRNDEVISRSLNAIPMSPTIKRSNSGNNGGGGEKKYRKPVNRGEQYY